MVHLAYLCCILYNSWYILIQTMLNPIRRARILAGLNRHEVAEILDVHRHTLARWEQDDFDPTTLPLRVLGRLRELYLQPSVWTLLGREDI